MMERIDRSWSPECAASMDNNRRVMAGLAPDVQPQETRLLHTACGRRSLPSGPHQAQRSLVVALRHANERRAGGKTIVAGRVAQRQRWRGWAGGPSGIVALKATIVGWRAG